MSKNPPTFGDDIVDIVLLEKDGDVFHLLFEAGEVSFEVITRLELVHDALFATDLHISGSGSGSASPAILRAAARKLAQSWGARAIRIQGGIRTTGASPGRRPRMITIPAAHGGE